MLPAASLKADLISLRGMIIGIFSNEFSQTAYGIVLPVELIVA
jgi:hypothetical protein